MSAPLGAIAVRLLTALRAERATAPERAITDARLAELIEAPARDIIDAAGELLEAGYIVCASTVKPPGRFLILPGGDLAPAISYARTLRSRGVACLRRRKLLMRAVDRHRAQRDGLFAFAETRS